MTSQRDSYFKKPSFEVAMRHSDTTPRSPSPMDVEEEPYRPRDNRESAHRYSGSERYPHAAGRTPDARHSHSQSYCQDDGPRSPVYRAFTGELVGHDLPSYQLSEPPHNFDLAYGSRVQSPPVPLLPGSFGKFGPGVYQTVDRNEQQFTRPLSGVYAPFPVVARSPLQFGVRDGYNSSEREREKVTHYSEIPRRNDGSLGTPSRSDESSSGLSRDLRRISPRREGARTKDRRSPERFRRESTHDEPRSSRSPRRTRGEEPRNDSVCQDRPISRPCVALESSLRDRVRELLPGPYQEDDGRRSRSRSRRRCASPRQHGRSGTTITSVSSRCGRSRSRSRSRRHSHKHEREERSRSSERMSSSARKHRRRSRSREREKRSEKKTRSRERENYSDKKKRAKTDRPYKVEKVSPPREQPGPASRYVEDVPKPKNDKAAKYSRAKTAFGKRPAGTTDRTQRRSISPLSRRPPDSVDPPRFKPTGPLGSLQRYSNLAPIPARKQPYSASTPAPLKVDDRVVWLDKDGVPVRGQIKYVGYISGESSRLEMERAGVLLDEPKGDPYFSGLVDGKRIFDCEPGRGVLTDLNCLTWDKHYVPGSKNSVKPDVGSLQSATSEIKVATRIVWYSHETAYALPPQRGAVYSVGDFGPLEGCNEQIGVLFDNPVGYEGWRGDFKGRFVVQCAPGYGRVVRREWIKLASDYDEAMERIISSSAACSTPGAGSEMWGGVSESENAADAQMSRQESATNEPRDTLSCKQLQSVIDGLKARLKPGNPKAVGKNGLLAGDPAADPTILASPTAATPPVVPPPPENLQIHVNRLTKFCPTQLGRDLPSDPTCKSVIDGVSQASEDVFRSLSELWNASSGPMRSQIDSTMCLLLLQYDGKRDKSASTCCCEKTVNAAEARQLQILETVVLERILHPQALVPCGALMEWTNNAGPLPCHEPPADQALFYFAAGKPVVLCPAHTTKIAEHGICPCGVFPFYGDQDNFGTCAKNHFYHRACFQSCPHTPCQSSDDDRPRT